VARLDISDIEVEPGLAPGVPAGLVEHEGRLAVMAEGEGLGLCARAAPHRYDAADNTRLAAGDVAKRVEARIKSPLCSLSAPGGGEGRGEVGDSRAVAVTHLTLPIASQWVPSLSPLKGGEGI
jgi:hypothetical protein